MNTVHLTKVLLTKALADAAEWNEEKARLKTALSDFAFDQSRKAKAHRSHVIAAHKQFAAQLRAELKRLQKGGVTSD